VTDSLDDFRLRRALRSDLPRLLELLAQGSTDPSRERETAPGAYTQAFDTIDRDPNQVLLVGELEGEPVAMAQVTFIPGTRLMQEAIALANKRGCRLVQLTSDKSRADAHRFYERLGFARSHDGFKFICA
jgi:GNAT superfamily N-acetyltransferase